MGTPTVQEIAAALYTTPSKAVQTAKEWGDELHDLRGRLQSWAASYRLLAREVEPTFDVEAPFTAKRGNEIHDRVIAEIRSCRARIAELEATLNTPELHDFAKGVVAEAQHQRERWGTDHDAGKTAADWFWLIGHLAGKALHSLVAGNVEKAKHHVITTAATLANWHASISGTDSRMRPGIAPPPGEDGPQ